MTKNYELTVEPGLVVRETYTVKYDKITKQQAPQVDGEFRAPYVANVEVPLGEEGVSVISDGNEFIADFRKRGNTTPKRILNLGKLVYKIIASECGAIFSKTDKSVVSYTGLPVEAEEAVKRAEEDFKKAWSAYNDARFLPEERTVLTKREIVRVTPKGIERIPAETLDDKI
jgi:hypothetical protein